jgi:hypothetical protein
MESEWRDAGMATRRDHRVLTPFRIAAGLLASGLALPTLATANHQELPAVYTLISSIEPDAHTAAFELGNDLLDLHRAAPQKSKRRKRSLRGIKPLLYSRVVAVGNEDVIVQLKGPGKKGSIMALEFKF